MASPSLSRRDVLKGTAAIAAAVSGGVDAVAGARRAAAAEAGAQPGSRIEGVLRRAVDDADVPGVVAMAATDQGVFYEGAFGSRDLGKGPAMTLDTVFRVASMVKAVTGVAAMQLVEQGRIALDAPVPDIDPALGAPQVLEGFDAARPKLRPASGRSRAAARPTLPGSAARSGTRTYCVTSGVGCLRCPAAIQPCMPLIFDPAKVGTASASNGSAASSNRSAAGARRLPAGKIFTPSA
jgi:hypothetical protein